MLVHFDRWSHRYDEWIFWDSDRLRPLEKPPLPKVAQKDEAEMPVCFFFSFSLYSVQFTAATGHAL